MALIEIKKDPSKAELRWFGGLFVLFFSLIGAWAYWKSLSTTAYTIWTVAGAVAIVFYAVPWARKPIYLGWVYATFPIGWTISHLVLVFIFYLVTTPLGLVMRGFGYDPLRRRFDTSATS